MSVNTVRLEQFGHPYVEIVVSADGKTGSRLTALIDTGFSGFVSLPLTAATLLGLKSHTTANYILANGKVSDAVPLAYGFAALDGDPFVSGLISISEHVSAAVGVDFLQRCGKGMLLTSNGVVFVDETELIGAVQGAARRQHEDNSQHHGPAISISHGG